MTTTDLRASGPAGDGGARPHAVSSVSGTGASSLARSVARVSSTTPPTGWSRVGTIQLRSAVRYLAVWAAVLCGVLLLVLVGGYVVLSVLGVTESASRALAIILDEPLPSSGVLPLLQASNVLPVAALISVVLSGLWFVAAMAAVLVHNAVTQLTGGLRVHLRSGSNGPRVPRSVPARAASAPDRL